MTARKRSKKTAAPRPPSAKAISAHLAELVDALGSKTVAERAGVSARTLRRWRKEGVPASRKEVVASTRASARELQRADALAIAKAARRDEETKTRPIKGKFGKKPQKIETERHRGFVVNRKMRLDQALLTEENAEQIKRDILESAKKIAKKKGRFIVRLSMVTVGRPTGYTVGRDAKKPLGHSRHGEVNAAVESSQYARANRMSERESVRERYRGGEVTGPEDLAGLAALVDDMLSGWIDDKSTARVVDAISVVKYQSSGNETKTKTNTNETTKTKTAKTTRRKK